jgi:hypothetical protein
VGENMTTDRLATIGAGEQRGCTRIRLDLIGLVARSVLFSDRIQELYHKNTDIELLSHMCKLHEELIELLLSLAELSSTREIDTKAVQYAVNDQQLVLSTSKLSRKPVQ